MIADGEKIAPITDEALSVPMFAEHNIGDLLRANEKNQSITGFTPFGVKPMCTLTHGASFGDCREHAP